jgi:hypothetical protein
MVLHKNNVIPSGFDDGLNNFSNPAIPSGLKLCKMEKLIFDGYLPINSNKHDTHRPPY